MSELAPVLKQKFSNANGVPLAGGKLFTYAAGTTTPLATYTDQTGITPNTNPVVLDSSGQADVWLGNQAYKFILQDSSGNVQWTVDNVQSAAFQISNSVTSTVSSSTPIVLTSLSSANQVITGSTAQALQLPVAATLAKGQPFVIYNNSSAVTTVTTSGSNTIQAMAANTVLNLLLINSSGGTGTASWVWFYGPANGAVLPISLGGTGTTTAPTQYGIIYASSALAYSSTPVGTAGQVFASNGSSAPTPQTIPGSTTILKAPTVSVATVSSHTGGMSANGSGTYTTPINPSPLYLKIRMVAGGGGGAGVNGGGGATNGGGGGNASFGTSLLTANGGGGGVVNGAAGTGGTASLGSGPVGVAIQGSNGDAAGGIAGAPGGSGGPGPFGGSGQGGTSDTSASGATSGVAGVTNSGSGGGGGGGKGGNGGSGGGAAGGFVDALITSPLATYSYVVGTAGTAGAGASTYPNGGAGAAGIIIVEEHYQ